MQATGGSSRAPDALDVAVNQVGLGSGIDKGGTGSVGAPPRANPVWCTAQVHAYAEVIVAVFPTSQEAQRGADQLRQAGFAAEQCGLVVRDGPLTQADGLLARGGCADHGPLDALRRLGVPGEAARLYQQTFDACQAVLVVRATGRADQAASLLRQLAKVEAAHAVIDPRPVPRQAADRPTRASGGAGRRPAAAPRRR
jgi:hypothetical protein